MGKNKILKRISLIGILLVLLVALVFSGLHIERTTISTITSQQTGSEIELTKHTNEVITIATIDEVQAGTTVDYVVDGVDDDVQFQQALDALPATGGSISIISSGTFSFSNTVSRAIDDVTVSGVGKGTYFQNDGSTALFSAGAQDGWVFKDFSTDAGGVNVATATNWYLQNVNLGTDYYSLSTSSNMTAVSLAVPSGRTASLTVSANDSSDESKAQADYVCDGVNDETEIQAAIDAIYADGGGKVILMESYTGFSTSNITIKGGVTLEGQGTGYLEYGTRISLTGSITMESQGRIGEIFIGCAPYYADDAVVFEGLGGSGLTMNAIDNVEFYCATRNGTAVLMRAVTDGMSNSSIVHDYFGAIYITGFKYGVKIQTDQTAGGISTFNANTFEYIGTWGCWYPVYYDYTSGDPGSNTFLQVQIQSVGASPTLAGVTVSGANNKFFNINGGDLATNPTLVVNADATYTYAAGLMPRWRDNGSYSQIRPVGQYDEVLTYPPLGISEFYNAEQVYAWNEYDTSYANDLSGKGNIATIVGGSYAKHGQMYAATFDGTNDYITVASANMTGSRSWLGVISPNFLESEGIVRYVFYWYADADNFVYVSNAVDGSMWYGLWSSAEYDFGGSNVTFAQNDILVYALVFNDDADTIDFYVNGKIIESDVHSNPLGNNSTTMYIGSEKTPASYWKGWMGVFANIPRALTEKEVVRLTDRLGTLYNADIVLENYGTGSIANGSTSDLITHGLSLTPDIGKIVINFTENSTSPAGTMWITSANSTYFTVNVANDPGASNLDFSWSYQQ